MSMKGKAPQRERYMVLLSCKHTVVYCSPKPKASDQVYCTYCQNFSYVQSALLEWSLKCRGCRYGKYCGADSAGARQRAEAHATKYQGHEVLVYEGNQIRHRAKVTITTIDWLAANPTHQSKLRSIGERQIVTKS